MEKLLSCISEKTTPCVFSIEVKDKAAKVKKNENSTSRKDKSTVRPSSYVTGFAVAQTDRHITILTCAHGFDKAYNKNVEVTVDQLTKNYQFRVICTHQRERDRKLATVKAVDCRKDLLLLELVSKCSYFHRPLTMGEPPKSQDLLVLQGWPPDLSGMVAYGRVTCFGRSYNDLTSDNNKGYNMVLTELTDLCCTHGCSGGPLVDGKLCYVGVYHGTQRYCGYAVSFDDMKFFVDTYFNAGG